MKKVLLITFILGQILAQTLTPVVVSDPSTTFITSPINQVVGYEAYHNLNNPNFTGIPSARWIYIAGRDAWPNGYRVVFQSLFNVDCPQVTAQLKITADNNFTAYLNGALIGSGTDWTRIYTFNVTLVCGVNNLTVVTINLHAGSPAALIFAIVQDQSTCYTCEQNPGAYYNRRNCQCQCTTRCDCIRNFQRYFGYPYCGCRCNVVRPCPIVQYWDQLNCACRCIPRLCAPLFYQNSRSCLCVCRRIACGPRQIQDPVTCQCVAA